MQQAVKGLGITSGSEHDLNAFRGTALNLHGAEIFADKAYIDRLEQEMPAQGQQVKLYTPVKKKKKQKQLFLFDQLLSAAANKIRQPIESLSGRPEEKTRIQIASEVRSYNGLSVHISGKLAAMFILIMNPLTSHL